MADGFLFGSEVLDGEDQLWDRFPSDLQVTGRIVAAGDVFSTAANSRDSDAGGLTLVNSRTLAVSPLIRNDESQLTQILSKIPIASAVSVYDVKYCRPLITSTVSSNVSHDLFKFCFRWRLQVRLLAQRCIVPERPQRNRLSEPSRYERSMRCWWHRVGVVNTCSTDCIMHSNGPAETVQQLPGKLRKRQAFERAVTRYMHMSKATAVQTASVTYKSVLGYVGSNGRLHGVSCAFPN